MLFIINRICFIIFCGRGGVSSKTMKNNRSKIILALIAAAVLLFTLTGCVSADVDFKADGSGTATLTVSRTDGMTRDSLSATLTDIFNKVKSRSGGERLTLQNITENDGYFTVKVKFKRIADTQGLGSFVFEDGDKFGIQRTERALFGNFASGKFIGTGKKISNYNDSLFTLPDVKANGVNPLSASGEVLSATELAMQDNPIYSADNTVFSFVIIGFEGLEQIMFSLPGSVVVYSDNLTLDGSKLTLDSPFFVDSEETYIGEDGTSTNVRNVSAKVFAGYAVFEKKADYTPWIIAGVCVLVVGGLIALGFVTGAFRKFFHSREFAHIKRHRLLYLFVLPGFVLLAIFNYAPMVGIIVAFKDYNVDDGIFGSEWVGFKHFVTLFTHPGSEFWTVFRNTFVMALLKFVFGFPAAIILALMFNALANGIFKKSVQTISYLPYFVSWVVVSNIVYLFLSARGGIVNNLLESMGKDSIRFYSEPKYWWGILTGTSVWKTVGWGTIVYLAAITGINSDLYEAASIDGAGAWTKLWTVTIPGMMPVIGIQLILSAGNLIKDDFDQIYSMVGGSNYELRGVTEVFSSLVYRNLQGGPSGYSPSTALSLVQSILSLGLVLGADAIVKKTDNQGLW